MNRQISADERGCRRIDLRSSAFICGFNQPDPLPLSSIATRFALFAADLAAAPWLGHGRISFRVVSRVVVIGRP